MINNRNNPLLDKDFLSKLDMEHGKEVYAKIIALNHNEDPIEEIEGKVTDGSVNIDGASNLQRSCSLSLVAKNLNIHDTYWGVESKFQLYVGLINEIDSRYDSIIWFNLGMYIITNFNTSITTNNYTVSISGKDKMCMLNGNLGGNIVACSIDFGKEEIINEDGSITYNYLKLKDIIREAIHVYGQEPYHNIIIEDLDQNGFELMEYRGDTPLYLFFNYKTSEVDNIKFEDITDNLIYPIWENNAPTQKTISLKANNFVYDTRTKDLEYNPESFTYIYTNVGTAADPIYNIYSVGKLEYGDTAGYRLTDLTYAGDLIVNVGSTLTSMLDLIVKMLGDYEYFYDVDGHFRFRRKKAYTNVSWNNIVNRQDERYADNAAYTSSFVYSFNGANLLTAIQNSPDFANIKNDYVIWGKKAENIPIHLRYAIDKKPVYYRNQDNKIFLTQEEYDRLVNEQSNNELITTNETTSYNVFHTTPIPAGLSEDWWEIDDWARRYLYFADIDNEQPITYYLNLTGQEVYDIVKAATQPTSSIKDFNYYVYQLKTIQLGNFGKTWQTEDWLSSLPQPEEINSSYYQRIHAASEAGTSFWCWLFDTAIDSNTGLEYIKSIEHGYVTSQIYPSSVTGCSHKFFYALERKNKGSNNWYHSYIFNPEVPDSLKSDTNFTQKISTDETETLVPITNYQIVDWREIIYQMAVDYYKYNTQDDFLSLIREKNIRYYPSGYTGYEQYYQDMEGFWRDTLYDTNINFLTPDKDVPDTKQRYYYIWDNNAKKFKEYSFHDATEVKGLDPNLTYYYKDVVFSVDEEYKNENYTSQILYPTESLYAAESNSIYTGCYFLNLGNNSWQVYKPYIFKKNQQQEFQEYKGIFDLQSLPYKKEYYYKNGNEYFLCEYDSIIDYSKLDQPTIVAPRFEWKNNTTYYENLGFEKSSSLKKGNTYYLQKEEIYNKINQVLSEHQFKDLGINYYTKSGPNYSLATQYNEDLANSYKYYRKTYNYVVAFTIQSNMDYYYKDKNGNLVKVEDYFIRGKTYYNSSGQQQFTYDINKIYYTNVGYKSIPLLDFAEHGQSHNYSYKTLATNNNTTNISIPDYLYPTRLYEQFIKTNTLEENKIYEQSNGQKRDPLLNFKRGQEYYIITHDYYMLINKELESFLSISKIQELLSNALANLHAEDFASYEEYQDVVEQIRKNYTKQITIQQASNLSLENIYIKEEENYIKAKDLAISIYNKRKSSAIPEDIQIEIANRAGLICDIKALKEQSQLSFIGFDEYRSVYKLMNTMSPYNYYNWGFFNLCYSKDDFPYNKSNPLYLLNDKYEFEIVNKELWNSNKQGYYTYLQSLSFEYNKYYIKEDTIFEDTYDDQGNKLDLKKIYLSDQFNPETYWTTYLNNPEKLIFWIDFIDTTYGGDLAQYGVPYIGDRPKTVNDDKIKAIYYRDTPPVVFKEKTQDIQEIIEVAQEGSYSYINVTDNIENLFSISAQTKSAFNELNSLLYNYSYCAEQVTLTALPIYYLEPNTRILINDSDSKVQGEYLITKMTIPLTYNGTMQIVATKAVDRIY